MYKRLLTWKVGMSIKKVTEAGVGTRNGCINKAIQILFISIEVCQEIPFKGNVAFLGLLAAASVNQ
jgi:hypothetical protein